ncbi:MAG: hypothetical protein ACRD2N_05695, partial [Vicinamibacterales bacterium]
MASATERRLRSVRRWPTGNMAALSVNIQCDGDLNYAPGVLWTAAHHKGAAVAIIVWVTGVF